MLLFTTAVYRSNASRSMRGDDSDDSDSSSGSGDSDSEDEVSRLVCGSSVYSSVEYSV